MPIFNISISSKIRAELFYLTKKLVIAFAIVFLKNVGIHALIPSYLLIFLLLSLYKITINQDHYLNS